MTGFVLGASVALGWLLDEPTSTYAARVQRQMLNGAQALVPIHWHLEIANALVIASRRSALRRDPDELLASIADLLPFVATDDQPDDIPTLVGLGQRQQLTAYDAAYLALAARRHLRIATQDKAMAAAARALRIGIVG